MAKRKSKKVDIDYGGVTYVSKLPKDLRPELDRIQDAIRRALRILHYLRRLRNNILRSACFQLRECLRPMPEDATAEELAAHIARVSNAMEDTCNLLNVLTHSRTKYIEEVRFILRYGQTPKKRDSAGSYGSKKRKTNDDD